MTPLTSILAATDFSVDGNHALRRAALLACEHGARLHILHVLEPSGCKPLRDWFSPSIDIELKGAQARETLRRFAVEIAGRRDVAASVEVRVGDTLATLMQASEHADLVVLGHRGTSGLKALLIGRTADRMLRTCRRPVLVVKAGADVPYRRVLLPVDFTASSDAAVELAARVVRGARLHVFHAMDSHRESLLRRAGMEESVIRDARARAEAGIHARMRRKLGRLGLDSTRASFAVDSGSAVAATLRHALALEADLIVAGKQGGSTLGRFLLGSVSSRVLSGSGCDMLIVPRPPGAALPAAAAGRAGPPTATARQGAPHRAGGEAAFAWAPAEPAQDASRMARRRPRRKAASEAMAGPYPGGGRTPS